MSTSMPPLPSKAGPGTVHLMPPLTHFVILGPVVFAVIATFVMLAQGRERPAILAVRLIITAALVYRTYAGGRISRAILAGSSIAVGLYFGFAGVFTIGRMPGLNAPAFLLGGGLLVYCGVTLLRNGPVRASLEARRKLPRSGA